MLILCGSLVTIALLWTSFYSSIGSSTSDNTWGVNLKYVIVKYLDFYIIKVLFCFNIA